MVDSSAAGPIAAVLQKTEPFLLDQTIDSLESISPGCAIHQYCPLPMGSNPGSGNGSGNSDDDSPPFLETFFNRTSNNNNDDDDDDYDYRSPGKSGGHPNANDTEVFELEESANEVWDAYRQLYYGSNAVGSVFVRRKDGASSSSSSPTKKKGKAGTGGALEALFGIRKTVAGEYGIAESARWESVHLVTIEAPNLDAKTCDYKIRSTVWCRYQPADVGDVPKAVRDKIIKQPVPTTPNKAPEPPKPKGKSAKALDITRLEIFDKAASNWDKHHHNNNNSGKAPKKKAPKKPKPKGPPPPPVPATVTSSALYTVETAKTCGIAGSAKSASSVPAAQHIRNIGTIIEKVEADTRSKLERVDAPRCVEILQGMYRPTLSPGLKLPNGTASGEPGTMISRLGGHATGMGVGMGLIGEIALKAQAKGLGGDGEANLKSLANTNTNTNTNTTNKALEGILAAEKKKLVVSPPTTDSEMSNLRAGLKPNGGSLRRVVPAKGGSGTSGQQQKQEQAAPPTPEFMKFRNNLKKSSAP
eukprot:jgi/Psemu1/36278/gm1.36278_g